MSVRIVTSSLDATSLEVVDREFVRVKFIMSSAPVDPASLTEGNVSAGATFVVDVCSARNGSMELSCNTVVSTLVFILDKKASNSFF